MLKSAVRACALFSATLGAAFFLACGNGDGNGAATTVRDESARPYMMGFSALPRELNAQSYAEAIDFAGEHGDLVLIQRMVPWADFLPGAGVSDQTAVTTASERDAVREKNLKLFFAIDPTDSSTGRDRIAGLPPSHAGRRFDDAEVRAAFLAYAEYVALNYKPAYLALGVEMNLYYEENREDFANFESLYSEAYDRVKRASPGTMVTVTLQYEDLQGLLPRDDPHYPSWELVRAFDPKIDIITITTYPEFAFSSPEAIPQNYYSQLAAFTDRPIAVAEMGYGSAVGQVDAQRGEEEQRAFLRRMLAEADSLSMPFIVWYAIWDPSYARNTPFSAFESIGLLRSDASEKAAWPVWQSAVSRPIGERVPAVGGR